MNIRPFRIKAILFDFDGTLTQPGTLNLSIIKARIGCPVDRPYLDFVKTLPIDQRENALTELENFELDAAAKSKPNPGAEELIPYIRSKGLKMGILTNNTLKAVELAFQNFETIGMSDFDRIISRDDPIRSKPNGDGILLAAEKLNVDVSELLVVGDYIFDIQAGNKAGAITLFLDQNPENQDPKIQNLKSEAREIALRESDYTISHLTELKKIIRLGMPLPTGKFPNELLKEILDQFTFHDPSVLINPGIGEDIAAVNVENEEVLLLKSDPITFATDAIGNYAVLVNANDIATSGAVPRWFLTTLLFPFGTTPSEIFQVMDDLKNVCQEWGITLCGGHTEITDAVNRPVVSGMLAGTVKRRNLIDKQNMQQGDLILLTKGVAVEGTSIIAREFKEKLKELGMTGAEIAECREFLSHISILKEAQIAAQSKGASAMHDVTEGGIASALEELSIAGHHKIRIEMEKIPVFPQTKKICRLLHIDPFGLIGSGSLLICCRADAAELLLSRIREAGIPISVIGKVLEKGEGIEAVREGIPARLPRFETDEITRLFQS